MNQNELYHHGTIGMRWGIRRYQNKDGTLTELGKKRYNRDILDNARKKKENRTPEDKLLDPERWVREDISNARDISGNASNMVNTAKEIEKMTRKKESKTTPNLSRMTDQELRNAINRLEMERRYAELTRPENVSRGRKITQNVLDYAGTITSLAASGLGIALSIRKLKD